MTACINQCVSRSVNGEEPTPREASRGNLCGGCCHRLDDWLRDIPVDVALLPTVMVAGGSQRYDGSTRTKQPEAPAPLNLGVAALTDRRPTEPRVGLPDSNNPAHLERPNGTYSGVRDPGDELWYELPDVVRTLEIIHTWAEDLRCELDPQRERRDLADDHTVQGECGYLLRALDRLVETSWVDEAMGEIKAVWVQLTRAHGLISGPALGHCFTVSCEGKVYRDRYTGFPACNACHRSYDGLDALKLRLTEEAAGG